MSDKDSSNSSNSEKPAILKNTRLAKGLTLEIVHEATKIPMDALKAIEEGYSSRILSPFYYRGFIKIYSEFLGLDVAEIYRQYGLDQPTKPIVPAATPVTPPFKPGSRKPPKLVQPPQPNVIWEQLQEGMAFILKPQTLKLIMRVLGFVVLVFLLFKIGGCISSHLGHRHGAVHGRAVYTPQDAQAGPERKAAAVVPAVTHESLQAASEDDKVEVAVRAVKDTWLRVKTDERVVFETTLSKGSMETWNADDRIELSGSHIEQLDMEVNGKHVGFLGGGERRIRRVWITKEGLTVKK